jgi:ABC-type methionine transport system permease subunit
MGSTNSQIVFKVMIPEAMPSLVSGCVTLTIINLIGYSAMAGAIGGGGPGRLGHPVRIPTVPRGRDVRLRRGDSG